MGFFSWFKSKNKSDQKPVQPNYSFNKSGKLPGTPSSGKLSNFSNGSRNIVSKKDNYNSSQNTSSDYPIIAPIDISPSVQDSYSSGNDSYSGGSDSSSGGCDSGGSCGGCD